MPVAWILGPSGTWGEAFGAALLDGGHDLVGLGPREQPSLRARAAGRGRSWVYMPLDLRHVTPEAAVALVREPPGGALPDVFIDAALAHEASRDALVQANFVARAWLLEAVIGAMESRGQGRIGVLVPQNARLGLAGLGDLAAPQAALWTWAEAVREELRARRSPVSVTIVIPPHAASDTQRLVSERSGRSAKVHPADAHRLVAGVLAGRRRAGRRPVLAALALLR